MPLVDRRIDTLRNITLRMQTARTTREALTLAQMQRSLQRELEESYAEVRASTTGWKYIPPPGVPTITQHLPE